MKKRAREMQTNGETPFYSPEAWYRRLNQTAYRDWSYVATIVSLLFALCANGVSAEKNIILFVTDDEGPTLGCYGDAIAKTPNIDAIAADGVRFTHAFATTASCSASRSVILSGVHNHKTGQYGHQHHFHKFSSYYDLVSLALPRILARGGYRTARCGKYHVAPEAVYHFDQTIQVSCRNAVAMAEECREFIGQSDDRPFFLYMATCDPHRSGRVDQTSQLEFKPNLFGNKPNKQNYPGVEEVFYDAAKIPVPDFLPNTPETQAELAQYYQSCSRIDAGLGRLVQILKEADLYDKTMIVFTSDHGMAFAGAKTTVYEPGLRVPFIVRDPYQDQRGLVCDSLVSHVDITPSLANFAGVLDATTNEPKNVLDASEFWKTQGNGLVHGENRNGGNRFQSYQGKSWMRLLSDPTQHTRDHIFASHTFHEITMYYPMRVFRDHRFKLILNIAHQLDYPFASDLWAAASWQAQLQKGTDAPYGVRTVGEYVRRPRFELYDLQSDPNESLNLAEKPEHQSTLKKYCERMRELQKELEDPWISKWDYE